MRSIHSNRINTVQILIGIAGLIVGSLVYLIDRPPEQTYFVNNSKIDISLFNTLPKLFGTLGNFLPDFLHVFSFILITAGLFSFTWRGALIICLGWFFIDGAFELFQRFNTLPLIIIPDWFEGIPFLENTRNYFQKGTFDTIDFIAIILGTVSAFFIILVTKRRDPT